MLDGIPAGFLNDASGVVFILIIGFMVLTGRLRSDRNVQEIRDDRDARITQLIDEISTWREAWHTSEEARGELQSSVETLLELARTTEDILKSLKREGNGDGKG